MEWAGGEQEDFRNLVLFQGYLMAQAPVDNGLRLDAGKFVTFVSAEWLEEAVNWNVSYGYIFTISQPYIFTGGRLNYFANDWLALNVYIANGGANFNLLPDGKQVGGQILFDYKPFHLWIDLVHGTEQYIIAGSTVHQQRYATDIIGIWEATEDLTIKADYIYGYAGTVNLAPFNGGSIHWQAAAGYIRYQFTDWFAATVRGEWYNDHDGFQTQDVALGSAVAPGTLPLGQRVQLYEVTFTPEFAPVPGFRPTGERKEKRPLMQFVKGNFFIRPEYRHDWATKDIFVLSPGEKRDEQDTVSLGIYYTW